MSYRTMSNREGNQQRIMDMHAAGMPARVTAAYMTEWGVPMSGQDVETIVKVYDPMGRLVARLQTGRARADTPSGRKTCSRLSRRTSGTSSPCERSSPLRNKTMKS